MRSTHWNGSLPKWWSARIPSGHGSNGGLEPPGRARRGGARTGFLATFPPLVSQIRGAELITARSIGRRYPELTMARSTRRVLSHTAASARQTGSVLGDEEYETSTSTSTGVASMPTSVYEASLASTERPSAPGKGNETELADAPSRRPRNAVAVDNSLPRRRDRNIPRPRITRHEPGCFEKADGSLFSRQRGTKKGRTETRNVSRLLFSTPFVHQRPDARACVDSFRYSFPAVRFPARFRTRVH
jgi:hypothetical protein